MNKLVLGGFLALLMVGVGFVWMQSGAQVARGAPPPVEPALHADPSALPLADASGLEGPAPPEVDPISREEQRFFRLDRNRDGRISRNEMLVPRTAAFRKLDKDGNNLLTFEEWAVTTVDRFSGADANNDGELSPEEFATTAPKPSPKKPACKC